jgi:predicted nucleic acid-binding protein
MGVLYAAFDAGDVEYHKIAASELLRLNQSNTQLIVPTCVVLETAKRLLFDVNASAMRRATAAMLETLEVVNTTAETLKEALELMLVMGHWGATLEDAIVINTALQLKVPVWTLNYRDFGSIKGLEFWTS